VFKVVKIYDDKDKMVLDYLERFDPRLFASWD